VSSEAIHLFLRRAMSGAVLVYGLGAVFAFASQILLARLMGALEYGVYYYAMSWVLILSLLVRFGLDNAALRLVPAYMQTGDWPAAKGVLRLGNRVVLLNGLLVGLVVVVVVLLLGGRISPSMRWTFLVAAACLPIVGLIYMRQAALRSFKRIARSLLPDAVIAPVLLMVMAACLLLTPIRLTAPMVMGLTLVSLVLAFGVGGYWLSRLWPPPMQDGEVRFERKAWLHFAVSMMLINGMHLLLNHVDSLVLGFFRQPDEVGIYGVASRSAFMVAFPLTMANAVFVPLIAERLVSGQLDELQRILRLGMRPVVAAAFVFAVILLVFGDFVLGLFGKEFVLGSTALRLLVVGQLVNASCGPVGVLLSSSGHQNLVLRVLTLTVAANLLLNFLVIPRWGMEGSAVVKSLSFMFWNIVLYQQVGKRIALDASGWRCRPSRKE